MEARLQPLQQALTALSTSDRAVLMLRDGEGLSSKEVAKALDLTDGAVRTRLHRARRAVRRSLDQGDVR